MLLKNNSTSVGTQIGINYHFYYSICPRVPLSYEDYYNQDRRFGMDFGLSILGVYIYAGYHYPLGKIENEEISRFRFGFKFIFNRALMKTAEKNWH